MAHLLQNDGARSNVCEFPNSIRGPRKLRAQSAALALGCATGALALFSPSEAWAACSTPNNTNCDVDAPATHGNFENGATANGTVNILNGISLSADANATFYNGNFDFGLLTAFTGTLNINSGAFYNSGMGSEFINGDGGPGIVNINGTFNNSTSGTFTNGNSDRGNVNILNGGIFNNDSGALFSNGEVFDEGTLTIQSGGTFNNNAGATFENADDGDGTVNVGGLFVNAGTFDSEINAGFGELIIQSGGEFRNESTASFDGANVTIDSGGVFNHYAGINARGDFTNNGTFNIGYSNPALATTNLTGSYTQSSSGTLSIRADFDTTTSDRLVVDGATVVNGEVSVQLLNFSVVGGLTKTFAGIITSTGIITDNGITLANQDTAVIDYELVKPDANNIDLQVTVNFTGGTDGGLTPNQDGVGGGINSAFASGAELGFMSALTGLATNEELANALDQLAPSGAGASSASMMQSGTTFAEQILSCRVTGEGDANAVIREGQCMWARGTVSHTSIDNNGQSYGATQTAPLYSAGAQVNLGGAWRLGGGIGYETSQLDTDAGSRTQSDRVHIGGVLKYNPGPLLLAATVTGAFGSSDSVRHVNIGPMSSTAWGNYDTDFVSGRFTAAYLMPMHTFYFKPQVDVAYMHVSRDGYRERDNGGDIALNVASSDDGVWSVTPALEIGTQVRLAGGGVARPFIRGGVTWRDTDSFVTNASFLGAPDSAPFAVTSSIDEVTADVAAGLDLITPSDTTLRLQYDGQFGDTVEQHIGSAKLSIRY